MTKAETKKTEQQPSATTGQLSVVKNSTVVAHQHDWAGACAQEWCSNFTMLTGSLTASSGFGSSLLSELHGDLTGPPQLALTRGPLALSHYLCHFLIADGIIR